MWAGRGAGWGMKCSSFGEGGALREVWGGAGGATVNTRLLAASHTQTRTAFIVTLAPGFQKCRRSSSQASRGWGEGGCHSPTPRCSLAPSCSSPG